MAKRKKRARRPASGQEQKQNPKKELTQEEDIKILRGMQQDFLRALQETQPPSKLIGRIKERGKP